MDCMSALDFNLPKTLEVRLLTAAEIQQVVPVFERQGTSLPIPQESAFVGAVDPNGVVVGFLVVQVQLHAEPMWIEQGNEHIFARLVSTAEKLISEKFGSRIVYVFAPAGKVARMAQLVGMQIEPWVVLSKVIEPAEPVQPVSPSDIDPIPSLPGETVSDVVSNLENEEVIQ